MQRKIFSISPIKRLTLIGIIPLFLFLATSSWAESLITDELIQAIIQVESNGDPSAVGDNGNSIGLMQVSKICLKEYITYREIERFGSLEEAHYATNLFDGMTVDERFVFSLNNLKKPEYNKKVGTWYLKRLEEHYLGDILLTGHPNICARDNLYKEMRVYWDYPTTTMDKIESVNVVGWDIPHLKGGEEKYKLMLILGAYNAGIGRLKKVNYNITKLPKSTQRYIKKVLKIYEKT